MDYSNNQTANFPNRRVRLHQILIALIHQQDNLELMDADTPTFDKPNMSSKDVDPAKWLDNNQRILKRYQSLVRSALALDALLEAEQSEL